MHLDESQLPYIRVGLRLEAPLGAADIVSAVLASDATTHYLPMIFAMSNHQLLCVREDVYAHVRVAASLTMGGRRVWVLGVGARQGLRQECCTVMPGRQRDRVIHVIHVRITYVLYRGG